MTNITLRILSTILLTNTIYAEVTLQDISIVSATKTEQKKENITANISIITALEIKDRGYHSVAEALQSMVGVSMIQNGPLGSATSVMLRGMDSKRTLVLIDGIRYNNITGLNGASYADLMIDDIAQIEVIKGAQSGIWGADASAGVINIISKKDKKAEHGSLFVEKGSFNTNKYGVTLSKKTDSFNIKLSHHMTKTDGFSALSPKLNNLALYEDDGYKNTTTSLGLGYVINDTNNIDLKYRSIKSEGEYDTFDNPDADALSNTQDRFMSFNFNHIDSFNEINIYMKQSKFNREYSAPNFENITETTHYKGKVKEYGFSSKIPYAQNSFLLVGAEYKKFEEYDSINQSYDNKGFFISNSYSLLGVLGEKTIFTQSLRHDSYSTFGDKTTAKIGVKHYHDTIDGLTTAINYGTAYSVPTLYQLYSIYGSININAESTRAFDVTFDYKDITLSYFDTTIDDLIDFDNTTFTYANIPKTSSITGMEITYKKEFYEDFLLSVNYTHLFKAQNHDGEALKRRAEDEIGLMLEYYGVNDLMIGIDTQYIGSREDIQFNPDFTSNKVDTGKYFLINLNANYTFDENIKWYAKIENLGNRLYQSVYGYASSPRAIYTGMKVQF